MRNKILVCFFLFTIIMYSQINDFNIKVISSSIEQKWKTKEIKTIYDFDGSRTFTFEVLVDKNQQELMGWGGCFNELGWTSLNLLSKDKKNEILAEIFDPVLGLKFDYCRMPIGANDYSLDYYSLNDTPNDFEMKNFNIDRDKKYLIPYIKEALSKNPYLKIWGSPWCPPAWMKYNNHYACRPSSNNNLMLSQQGKEMQTQFIMEDKYLNSYALYFSKFISSYKKEGINISAIQVQNEPNSCQIFPSCVWRPEDLAIFIGEYLGPKLKQDHSEVELWLGTIERPQYERIERILNDLFASKYIKGVGFQWAGKNAIPKINKEFSSLKLMQTETECGNGDNDWNALEYTFDLMKHYFENGANAYMYWNFVLDETGKSQWGWKQNSMITINSITKEIIYNPEFYLMKHFSHFILPNAFKIETVGINKDLLAFKNPDNSIIIVLCNKDSIDKDLDFKIGNKIYSFLVEKKSINTVILTEN